MGILAVLYLLRTIAQHTASIISTKQKLFCDNATAVTHANTTFALSIKSYIAADYDLSKERETIKATGLDLYTQWFKAHQDDQSPIATLSIKAQLNVQAEIDVTQF
eukprot:6447643-Ditylum_brightwellii.AAC.1